MAFVLSIAVLAFLYGIATQAFGWFPSSHLQRAWNQAEAISSLGTDDAGSSHWTASKVYDRAGAHTKDSAAVQSGLTLIATHWEDFDWSNGLKLIDRSGRVVHEWQIPATDIFTNPPDEHVRRNPATSSIHGTHLFPNGDALVSIEYVGLVCVDACSNVKWILPIGGHHSIARTEDGSFWVSAQTFEAPENAERKETIYPGITPVQWDLIVRITEDGEVRESHRVLDIIFDNGLEDHVPATSWHNADDIDVTDITHLNDVEPLSAASADEYPLFAPGDLLISLNHMDLVLVFDPDSGHVKWHASEPFIGQHDPDFLGGGWIGVFDNKRDGTDRGKMLGGSRIVALRPHTDSMRVLFPTENSEVFHTDFQGKWQELENGNLLLTESSAGRIVEVAPDGRTVWEWITPPYDENRIPEVTEGTRYDLTIDRVGSWPCPPDDIEGTPQ